MFCINCGKKFTDESKYCTGCGTSVTSGKETLISSNTSEERWWIRLARVVYITLLLPLLIIVPVVWSSNAPYYSSYSHQSYGSYSEAFWYSLLTLIIYVVTVRLIKITFLYVTLGEKPKLSVEFKKIF